MVMMNVFFLTRRRAQLILVGAAFFGAALLAIYPMVGHLYLPLVDLPNHIARFAVMARPDGALSAYYEVGSNLFVPNSAVDFLWQASGMGGDPVLFSRLSMMVYAVNLILSVMVLNRVATGRWSVWPAVAGLLVYNGNFIWGFQNYVFTVPFSIHALSLWLVMEKRSTAWRAVVFLPISAVLFLMHLLAFAVLATAVLGRELHRVLLSGRAWGRQLGQLTVSGIPFLVPLSWYLYQSMIQPAGELGRRTEFGDWSHRLRGLLSIQWEKPLADVPGMFSSGLVILVLFGMCVLTLLAKSGPRLQIAAPLKGPIMALLVLSLLAPPWLNGVALIHIRFPFVALALLIAGSRWIDLRPMHRGLLFALFAGLFVQKSLQFEKLGALHNAEMQDLRATISDIPPGSRLLPLRAPGQERMRRLWHVQAYASVHHDVFVPTFFQGSHSVKLRSAWREYAAAADIPVDMRRAFAPAKSVPEQESAYWTNWQRKFTHVLILDEIRDGALEGQNLREMKAFGRFRLLEVMPVAD